MCSDRTDVAGTSRTRMAMIEILKYFVSFFLRHSKGSVPRRKTCFYTSNCMNPGMITGIPVCVEKVRNSYMM